MLLTDHAAAAGGAVLRAVFAGVARLRPAPKPLHPHGAVLTATVVRLGLATPVGVPWLDHAGEDQALVRLSPGAGLPAPLPDVQGLAIRVQARGQHAADLLMATTGLSPLGRFVLVPRRRAEGVAYSTLMPYRTPTGPLVLAARPRNSGDGAALDLLAARPWGHWERFGVLLLPEAPFDAPDSPLSFDPVLNTLPGLDVPTWVARLRAGAYAAARAERRRREAEAPAPSPSG